MNTLEKIRWQHVLFSDNPSRLDIMKLKFNGQCLSIKINVFRNQVFEPIESLLSSYFFYFGIKIELFYSDYDDSFSFIGMKSDASIYMLWIDYGRYLSTQSSEAISSWIQTRILALRELTTRPIVLNDCPGFFKESVMINHVLQSKLSSFPLLFIGDVFGQLTTLGDKAYCERLSEITSSYYSNVAYLTLARSICTKWISPFFISRIKVLILDLDNTLYDGVLGEDGIQNLVITHEHIMLQQHLMTLHKAGFLLAISTKNEINDVETLFAKPDFQIKKDAISAIVANWDSKSHHLKKIADRLCVGIDAILFIDDNISELCEVATTIPELHFIHANSPGETLRVLQNHPGCQVNSVLETDLLRAEDLKAKITRDKLANTAQDKMEYFQKLQMQLTFFVNPTDQIKRISELSNKTNQFNTSFLRFTELDISNKITQPDTYQIITVQLNDILTDSGVIAAIFFEKKDSILKTENIVISCRALGRNIEMYILLQSIKILRNWFPFEMIKIPFTAGPRNEPARKLLQENFSQYQNDYYLNNDQLNENMKYYLNFPIKKTIKGREYFYERA